MGAAIVLCVFIFLHRSIIRAELLPMALFFKCADLTKRIVSPLPLALTAAPHWGKFWLAVLGVYDWAGVNPVPPELVRVKLLCVFS